MNLSCRFRRNSGRNSGFRSDFEGLAGIRVVFRIGILEQVDRPLLRLTSPLLTLTSVKYTVLQIDAMEEEAVDADANAD